MGFLNRLERRSSVSWQQVAEYLAGPPASSGQQVTEKSAMRLSAVWACVGLKADMIAEPPIALYRRLPQGGRERATDDPRDALVRRRPWRRPTTAFTWRQTLQAHAESWGNGYAEVLPDSRGLPTGLKPLLPDRTEPIELRGRVWYRTRDAQGRDLPLIPVERIFHLPGLGFDGIRGYSVISMAREAIGTGMAIDEYAGKFWRDGARHDLVVSYESAVKPDAVDKLRKMIEKQKRQSYGTLILDHGAKAVPRSIPPEDAQFLEGRHFTVEEICRIFRVPPHMVAEHSHSQPRANMEEENRGFIERSLLGWFRRWEEQLNAALLLESEQDTMFFKVNLNALLRGNVEDRFRTYETRRQWGLATANEIRELEDEDPLEGAAGNTVLIPLNMIPVTVGEDVPDPSDQMRAHLERLHEALGQTTAAGPLGGAGIHGPVQVGSTPAPAITPRTASRSAVQRRSIEARLRLRRAYRRLIAAAGSRIVVQEVRRLERLVEKAFNSSAPVQTLLAELEQIFGDIKQIADREIMGPLLSLAEALAGELEDAGYGAGMTEYLEAFVGDQAGRYAAHHVGSSRGQLEALITDTHPDELQETLGTRLSEWEERRPEKIGRWESISQSEAIATWIYAGAGVSFIVWRVGGESCSLCEKLAGRRSPVGGVFAQAGEVIEGEEGDGPLVLRRSIPHAPLHDGCDCWTEPG